MTIDRYRRKRKALLAYHGLTHAQIAREMGLSQSTVQTVVNGYRTSRRVQEYIASRLNVPFEKLWGKPYNHHKAILADKKRAVND
jgi:lambda repressor-like predicted transcriptional regulator